MTHKRPDCLERPRKKGAKYTNRNIAPDEGAQHVEVGYDAKRDRWNGYDPAEHKMIYEEYEAVEAERQRLREEEIDKQTTTDMAAVRKVAKAGKAEGKEGDPDFGSSDEEDADEDKYADAADAVGQKMDTKTRITVRNLRIREDTAKYLINLDPSSAYYDPKTRSMRDNPLLNVPPEEVRCGHFSDRAQGRLHAQKAMFAGDNFLRYSGEAPEVQELQLFAWQSEARGNDIHLNANPTQGQLLHEAFKEKKEELRDTSKVSVLAKYGGEEHLAKPPKELLLGQTEEYVEYSRAGQVIHGKERAMTRSKYPEDGSFPRLCFDLLWLTHLFLSQSTSTTTRLYGDRGMIRGQIRGAMRVVTPPCTSHTALERTESTLPLRRARRICSWESANIQRIRL
jgi:pre-mRNA-processing factor SLU7